MDEKYICCYSGGKDSTAMLIYILENDLPLDEIIYCDVGDWMWDCTEEHINKVKETLDIDISVIDITEEIRTGFLRWGFPGFMNRWCTGFKRDRIRDYLKSKYEGTDKFVQYIGYCADENHRTDKKLFAHYDVSYPLVDAGITTEDALKMCYEYGFDFGGIYEHHSHFNCWMCPMQRVDELRWIFENDKEKWDRLRDMQYQTSGTFYSKDTVFDCEKKFWKKHQKEFKNNQIEARKKYNKFRVNKEKNKGKKE